MPFDRNAAVASAIAESRLRRLPGEVAAALTDDAVFLEALAGGLVLRQGHAASAGLLVTGLIRVFHAAARGRPTPRDDEERP